MKPGQDTVAPQPITRQLWFTLGIYLICGGALLLSFGSSASFYWATRADANSLAQASILWAISAVSLLHAFSAAYLVWRSDVASRTVRTVCAAISGIYILLQIGSVIALLWLLAVIGS